MGAEAIGSFPAYISWGQVLQIDSDAVLTAPGVFIDSLSDVDFVGDVAVTVNNVENLTVTMEVSAVGKTGAWLVNNLDGASSGTNNGGTDLAISRDATSVTIVSSSGADASIPTANGSNAGILTAALYSKLAGIEAGAEVNLTAAEIVAAIDAQLGSEDWKDAGIGTSTNLTYSADADSVTVISSTGTDADIAAATNTTAGVMSAAQVVKLESIQAGAEVNYSSVDALLNYGQTFGLAGNFVGQPTLSVTSNGTTISATVGAQDYITALGSGTFAGATISLQAGTSSVPVQNFIYVQASDSSLQFSTSGFPTDPAVLYVPVAIVLCQSAVNVQADGPYSITRFYAHTSAFQEFGPAAAFHLAAQQDEPIWLSGMQASHAITVNAGTVDDIDIAFTSGAFRRGRRVAVLARDTAATDSLYIANHATVPYTKTGNLGTPLLTSSGGAAAADGDYAVLVVWAAVSDTETASKLFVNLPSGFYKSEADARADAKAFATYAPPAALRNSAVLLARMIFRYTTANNGTWTHVTTTDLRGAKPSYFLTGTPESKEHLTSDFRLRDNTDITKQIAFSNAGNTPGQTRVVTVPDVSGTMAYLDVAQSFAAGAKKTFTHNGTTAGIRLEPIAGDPSAPADGDLWYNSSTGKFRKRQNGVTEDMDIAASAAAGGLDTQFQFSNGGDFAGAAGLTYDEATNRPVIPNGYELGQPGTLPTDAPTTSTIIAHSTDLRGDRTIRTVDDRGHIQFMQPHLVDKQIGVLQAQGNFATMSTMGAIAFTASGTASGVTQGTTSLRNAVARVTYTSNATASDSGTTNGTAGIRYAFRDAFRGNGTVPGGYYLCVVWALTTLTTNVRGSPCHVWFATTGLVGNVAMNTLQNFAGFCFDSGDVNYSVVNNINTTGTKTGLGSNFPINTTDLYRGHIWCYGNDTELYYRLENLTTGNSVEGAFDNTKLISNTQIVGWGAQINNGTDAAAVAIDIARVYWERNSVATA